MITLLHKDLIKFRNSKIGTALRDSMKFAQTEQEYFKREAKAEREATAKRDNLESAQDSSTGRQN